jgi:hypothetical protein
MVYDGDNAFLLYTDVVKGERDGFIVMFLNRKDSIRGYTGSDDFNEYIEGRQINIPEDVPAESYYTVDTANDKLAVIRNDKMMKIFNSIRMRLTDRSKIYDHLVKAIYDTISKRKGFVKVAEEPEPAEPVAGPVAEPAEVVAEEPAVVAENEPINCSGLEEKDCLPPNCKYVNGKKRSFCRSAKNKRRKKKGNQVKAPVVVEEAQEHAVEEEPAVAQEQTMAQEPGQREREVVEPEQEEEVITIQQLQVFIERLRALCEMVDGDEKPKYEDLIEESSAFIYLPFRESLPLIKHELRTIEEQYIMDPMKYKLIVDTLKHLYEEIAFMNYNRLKIKREYTPSKENPDFQKIIEEKEEFRILKQEFDDNNFLEKAETACNHRVIKYQNHQKLISLVMESYSAMLVYHGTGVGKTCSSIISAELYMDKNPKGRTHIILPRAVVGSFMKEIFNVDAYVEGTPQCTRDKYPMMANMVGETNIRILQKAISKIIKNRYTFDGYDSFANKFKKKRKSLYEKYVRNPELAKQKFHNWIMSTYDQSFFIIDEAHKLRSGNKQDKAVYKVLEYIFRVVKNVKCVAMTATPIYNSPDEIAELISLLRIAEKRAPVSLEKLMNEDDYLIQKTSGYISYMRSENPLYFAQSVFPSRFNPEIELINKPTISYNGFELPEEREFNAFELIETEFSVEQSEKMKDTLDEILANIQNEKDEDDFDTGLTPRENGRLLQISNLCVPKIGEENASLSHDNALKHHLYRKIVEKNRIDFLKTYKNKQIQYTYKDDSIEDNGGIFTLDNLEKYAKKIAEIVKSSVACVQSGQDGLIFIYSRYKEGGAIPVALALEEAGFTKYGGIPLLKNPQTGRKIDYRGFYEDEYEAFDQERKEELGKFVQAKYSVLTSDSESLPISKFNDQEIRKSTLKSNLQGRHIKVIIGTGVVSEGVDFHNIRSLHVLEPWYNFSTLKQIIGRGVRFCRHSDLPLSKRNVMINLYGTKYHNSLEYRDHETIDMLLYRLAQQKAKLIGKKTRLLKRNAIDCNLNKEVNILQDVGEFSDSIFMNSSRGNIPIGDKPGSYICDFMENCTYECTNDYVDELNSNTVTFTPRRFNYEIDSYITQISQAMETHSVLDVRTLGLDNTILTEALLRMNKNDQYVIRNGDTPGVIEMIGDNHIVFRPLNIDSEYLSLHHRTVDPVVKSRYSISYYRKQKYSKQGERDEEGQKEMNLEGILRMLKDDIFAEIDFTYRPVPRIYTIMKDGKEIKITLDNNSYVPTTIQMTRNLVSTIGNRFIRNKHELLGQVYREMLFEIFINSDIRGEYFLQEICSLLIDNRDIPVLNENETGELLRILQPYMLRNKEDNVMGYIMIKKDGLVVKIRDENGEYSLDAKQKSLLDSKINREISGIQQFSDIMGYRFDFGNHYNFKIIDIVEGGDTTRGFDCHTTGQINQKEKAYKRFDLINTYGVEPMDLLLYKSKDEKGKCMRLPNEKNWFQCGDREKIQQRKKYPGRIMCIVSEILLRLKEKDESGKHFFTPPLNKLFYSRKPLENMIQK